MTSPLHPPAVRPPTPPDYFAGRGLDFVLGAGCCSMKNFMAFTSACVSVGVNRIWRRLTASKSSRSTGSTRKLTSFVAADVVSDLGCPTSDRVNISDLSGNPRLPVNTVIQYITAGQWQLENGKEFMPGNREAR